MFWRRWIRAHPERIAEARDPRRPFPEELLRCFAHLDRTRIDVLEVGAGIFGFGNWHPTLQIRLVRTDILAERYNRMLERSGIELPIHPVYADAEKLVPQFGADSFDLVYATNCLDHMEQPVTAVLQMVSVARQDGYVVMWHEVDEAEHQDYAGLHQWNLNADGGHLIIWNQAVRHDVTEMLGASCEVRADVRDDVLHVEIRKRVPGVISGPDRGR